MDYGKKLLEWVSFLSLLEIFYFYNHYMEIGGFGIGYQYFGCIFLAAIGVSAFLAVPDLPYFYEIIKTSGALAATYFIIMLYSIGIWIFSFTPIRQMISGLFESAYMILSIFGVAALAYILRKKMIEYSFWALAAAFFLHLLPKIFQFGIVGFFRRLAAYLTSGGINGMGVSLEATSYSYIFTFFLIYFVVHRKEEKLSRQILRLTIIFLALLDTFKRSSLIAMIVSAVIIRVYILCPDKYRRYFLNLLIVVFLLSAFIYIPLIRYNLFDRIVEMLNINTSSRTKIYAYYDQYYEFSLVYPGRGLGWVHRLVSDMEKFDGLPALNVHCDYVRFYIELGFWGYLLWICSIFPWSVKKVVKGISAREDAVIIGVSIALSVLRITENISMLYSAIIGLSIIILQSVINSLDIQQENCGDCV